MPPTPPAAGRSGHGAAFRGDALTTDRATPGAADVVALPLAEVAHELRAPLTTIAGLARTVRDRRDVLTDEQVVHLTTRIAESAERLERLVRELLDLPTAPTGEATLAPPTMVPAPLATASVLLAPLVEAAVDDARGDLRVTLQIAHDLEVIADASELGEVHVDVPEDLRVAADADALHRVVVNLVSNARKYGAPPIEVLARVEGARVDLSVTDHGPGVPEEFRERLFAPFTRAAGAGGGRDGVGLGLSITRSLVLRQHGSIRHEHHAPRGSRFVVTLPLG